MSASSAVSTRPGVKQADAEMGRRLQKIRKIAGMTQSQMARKAGVSYQQIQKYELGLNRISAVRLRQLAGILGVPVVYFYDESENAIFDEINARKTIKELWDALPPGPARAGLHILLLALGRMEERDGVPES